MNPLNKKKPLPLPPSPKQVAGIKNIIAVASGKGGVGKSTVAVNFAASLRSLGYSVGLLDADIYGPSIGRMMGLNEKPTVTNNLMSTVENHSIKCMSMSLLVDENSPLVWRGPMLSKALKQMMLDTDWGELDFMIMDLPPGTGDIHLNIAQNFILSGAVIVSTPQDVALMDVKKAISMFRKVNIPILGIVENMSFFIDPSSGDKTYIFGEGGGKKISSELDIDLLGEIPLLPLITEASDNGTPFVIKHPNNEISKIYNEMTLKVLEKL